MESLTRGMGSGCGCASMVSASMRSSKPLRCATHWALAATVRQWVSKARVSVGIGSSVCEQGTFASATRFARQVGQVGDFADVRRDVTQEVRQVEQNTLPQGMCCVEDRLGKMVSRQILQVWSVLVIPVVVMQLMSGAGDIVEVGRRPPSCRFELLAVDWYCC